MIPGSPAASADRLPATAEVVRWGQAPLAFSLETRHAEVAARARLVFAPWRAADDTPAIASFRVDEVDADAAPPLSATAGAAPASGKWQVQASDGAAWRCRSIDEAVRTIEYRAVQSFVPRTSGAIAIHGALVDLGGRGAIVVGPHAAGKSSLACALWRDGAALLSDDVALVDLATGEARPGPRRIALRHGSRVLLGEAFWRAIATAPATATTDEGLCFHPCEVDGRPRPSATRLAAAVFLSHPDQATTEPAGLSRIPPAQSVLAWLPYVVADGRVDPGEAIRRLAPLAARVPAWRLARAPLAAMVERARSAAAEPSS